MSFASPTPGSAEILERRRAALEHVQREHIVEGFAAAASEKGYAATTTADIARLARVSKSSIYAHFADKEAIYLHLHAGVADALLDALTASVERTAGESDWRARIRDLVRARLEVMASNPVFLAQVRIEPQVATAAAATARRNAGRRSAALHIGLSREIAASTREVAELTPELATAGLTGNLALIAQAAERGPAAVRNLEDTLTDFWIRLFRAG